MQHAQHHIAYSFLNLAMPVLVRDTKDPSSLAVRVPHKGSTSPSARWEGQCRGWWQVDPLAWPEEQGDQYGCNRFEHLLAEDFGQVVVPHGFQTKESQHQSAQRAGLEVQRIYFKRIYTWYASAMARCYINYCMDVSINGIFWTCVASLCWVCLIGQHLFFPERLLVWSKFANARLTTLWWRMRGFSKNCSLMGAKRLASTRNVRGIKWALSDEHLDQSSTDQHYVFAFFCIDICMYMHAMIIYYTLEREAYTLAI